MHEWLSLATIVPLLLHVIINWDLTLSWMVRFAEKLRTVSRLNLLVDIALFVSAVGVMLSGAMVSHVVSSALGLKVTPSAMWVALHSVTRRCSRCGGT